MVLLALVTNCLGFSQIRDSLCRYGRLFLPCSLVSCFGFGSVFGFGCLLAVWPEAWERGFGHVALNQSRVATPRPAWLWALMVSGPGVVFCGLRSLAFLCVGRSCAWSLARGLPMLARGASLC